jgi:hypothetical protein
MKGRDYMGDVGVDGRIKIRILNKALGFRMDSIGFG